MATSLNEADATLLLAFLRRARTALAASNWKPGDLGTLEMFLRGDIHRAEDSVLGDLADEWDVKFRENFLSFVGADEDGNAPFHFRTFAREESEYWQLDGTPLHALAPFPIFGLYLIREGDRWAYGDFLENIFCYPTEADDAAEPNRWGQTPLQEFFDSNEGAEMGYSGEGCEYLYGTDPDKMDSDPRFSERHTFGARADDLVLADLDESDLRDPERALDAIQAQLFDNAREGALDWFKGNACHPKAVLEA
jgi:hypothetical protein